MADVLAFERGRALSEAHASQAEQDFTSDAEGRIRALDTRESWIIEAPAGSGKTGLLIQRYLALLASPDVLAPEQVLAITFTRAATAEIRERILQQLVAASEGREATDPFAQRSLQLARAVLDRDEEFDWQLLREPRRLRIATIDALCSEIVRSLPPGRRKAAALAPIERAKPLYREAAQRTLLRLGSATTADDELLSRAIRDLLLHRDGDLRSCESLIADMLAHREQWSELVPFSSATLGDTTLDETTLPRLNNGLRQTVRETLKRCAAAIPPFTLERLAGVAAELAFAEPHPDRPVHPLLPCRDFVGPPPAEPEFLEAWKSMLRLVLLASGGWRRRFSWRDIGVVTTKEQKESLKAITETLSPIPELSDAAANCFRVPAPVYPAADWLLAKTLFRVLHAAVGELAMVFEERGSCDFGEVSIQARAALEEARATGQELEAVSALRHLLVDEMQDTSSRQYDLLERLTAGWDGRTRTVFLVGDPKQSIYLFRQARVERFLASLSERQLGQIPLQALRLTANFRSQSALVEAANSTFAQVFRATGESEVSYTASVASRSATASPDESLVWHLAEVSAEDEDSARTLQEVRDRDAQTIRDLLKQWISRPLPPGRTVPWRVAVLVRSRKSLSRLLPALRGGADPLPFRAVEIEGLGERREVLDLLALTRALLHPGDRIAWLAVLRAPWCGLTLADLHQLTGADDSALRSRTVLSLAETRREHLSEDGQLRLEHTMQLLERAMDLADELRTPELVERTWRALRGDLLLSETELQNALTFLKLLRTLDREEGWIDLITLESRVDDLRAAATSAPVQIELVTIHGAKGLEWDFVVVPELDRSPPSSRSDLLLWEELSSGEGLLLAPVQERGEKPSPLQRWLMHLRAAREEAEDRRLLYVAATRAREELHLFGAAFSGKEGAQPRANTLLEAAWPAAREHVAPLVEESGLSLAAAATEDAPRPAPTLERVIDTGPGLPRMNSISETAPTAPYPSQGSVLARAIGTVAHQLLDYSTQRIAGGASPVELARELEISWHGRIRTLLLAGGVGPADLPRGTDRVVQVLQRTFTSPVGQWLLASHPEARSELALTEWTEGLQRLRVDRTFRAGEQPLAPGLSQRWIIDYKTSTPGHADPHEFFAAEQALYRGQLERYAATLRRQGEAEITLGLWFPLLARLVWWPAPESGSLALSAWHLAG